jgi:hypothetical protein
VSASRYASSTSLTMQAASGRVVKYLAIRILPFGDSVAGTSATRVQANEVNRLDLIATRVLGDPEQAWRIADANDAIDPFGLCDQAGAVLRLPASLL